MSTTAPPVSRTPRVIASLVCVAQALVLLGWCAFYAYEIAIGASDDVTRAAMSVLLIALFAAALFALGHIWFRTDNWWPRTPTIVWNLLLLPVAWSLHQSGRSLIAVGVALLAIVGIGSAMATANEQQDAGRDSD
ncbi:MAG: hypothetical protein LWW86_05560 [Micrococcales bacterium]|nr:hypothetical protein [Micrococcales bacterium]